MCVDRAMSGGWRPSFASVAIVLALTGCDAAPEAWDTRLAAVEADVVALAQRVTDVEALFQRIADVEAGVADALASVESLAGTVESLAATVAALPGGADACPDEMVRVGEFCIDRWKASVWDEPDCAGTSYGLDRPDFPDTFPASGDWTAPLYACSVEGVVPAGNVTWFQASQACALSGKSLCTNAQWQTAVAGTPSAESDCALSTGAPVETGSFPACVSRWGTHDQVGIRWEWTADWSSGGAAWMTAADGDSGRQTPWPESYGDGVDYTLNVNGEAMGAGSMMPGLPSAMIRGGDYSTGAEGGSFAMSRARGPSHLAPYIGFRCCSVP
ncbi:MAG: hypothetical protein Q8P41_10945 [Pseudomonadota bacterium]|nr:hypothetical protein [Pseudomonadota bacterium]